MLISLLRLFLLIPLVLASSSAFAQTAAAIAMPARPALVTEPALSAAADAQPPAGQSSTWARRDSLWNGTLVGMGLGALTGAFAGNAWLDDSASAGFNVPLTFGAIGAGAGAGLGAWIDARHGSAAPSPRRMTRMGLAPVVGKNARGAVGWIRF